MSVTIPRRRARTLDVTPGGNCTSLRPGRNLTRALMVSATLGLALAPGSSRANSEGHMQHQDGSRKSQGHGATGQSSADKNGRRTPGYRNSAGRLNLQIAGDTPLRLGALSSTTTLNVARIKWGIAVRNKAPWATLRVNKASSQHKLGETAKAREELATLCSILSEELLPMAGAYRTAAQASATVGKKTKAKSSNKSAKRKQSSKPQGAEDLLHAARFVHGATANVIAFAELAALPTTTTNELSVIIQAVETNLARLTSSAHGATIEELHQVENHLASYLEQRALTAHVALGSLAESLLKIVTSATASEKRGEHEATRRSMQELLDLVEKRYVRGPDSATTAKMSSATRKMRSALATTRKGAKLSERADLAHLLGPSIDGLSPLWIGILNAIGPLSSIAELADIALELELPATRVGDDGPTLDGDQDGKEKERVASPYAKHLKTIVAEVSRLNTVLNAAAKTP